VSLHVEDGRTRSARFARTKGREERADVVTYGAKMEERSVHSSIGDINSAEATKSKRESVNVKSSTAPSSGRERTVTSLRDRRVSPLLLKILKSLIPERF